MDEEPRPSVAFRSVRIGARRGRFDPILIGVVVVAAALALATLKPWGDGLTPAPSRPPATAPPAATAPPSSTAADGTPGLILVPTDGTVAARQAALLAAMLPDDEAEVGVQVITGDPATTALERLWVSATNRATTVDDPVVIATDRAILGIGVTAPPTDPAIDLRVWRPTDDGGVSWLPSTTIRADQPGRFLVLPPGDDGGFDRTWPADRYRLDVLFASHVQSIDLALTTRFERLPALRPPDPPTVGLQDPLPLDLTGIDPGPFSVSDRLAANLPIATGSLEAEARRWRDGETGPGTASIFGDIAAEWLPRATGLGVLYPDGASEFATQLRPLDPGRACCLSIGRIDGTWINDAEHAPWTLFTVTGSDGRPLAWPPGLYVLSMRWLDAGGPHLVTSTIELMPVVPAA